MADAWTYRVTLTIVVENKLFATPDRWAWEEVTGCATVVDDCRRVTPTGELARYLDRVLTPTDADVKQELIDDPDIVMGCTGGFRGTRVHAAHRSEGPMRPLCGVSSSLASITEQATVTCERCLDVHRDVVREAVRARLARDYDDGA